MEKYIDELFTESILSEGLAQFGVISKKKLGDFENYVFEGSLGDQPVIVRFTHSSHRTAVEIESELHWLMYLKSNSADVCGPLPSLHNNMIEKIIADDRNTFFVCMFEKAKGNSVDIKKELHNPSLLTAWGKATGKLHHITKRYSKPPEIPKRSDLISSFSSQFDPYLPDDGLIKKRVNHVVQKTRSIPQTPETYGLIHSDIHSGNFFFDGREVFIFDFDDAGYHYLASDLAIPLYYSLLHISDKKTRDEEAGRFLFYFLKGYEQLSTLPPGCLNDLEVLMMFRDCELYGVLNKKWDTTQLNEKQAGFLNGIKVRILEATPLVSL
ncbi:phosphotransferase [Bacillus sp. H-16]|uniref:phosphotransferase enzyme family protein n=1 Tax=Alteribacter salitolerans TaxID=2912333 RepID=UPI001962DC1A|nr:phosphotransferase [Alteribacter salitolerans]MBM7094513.1 phosphotransferase [Alteribacter salitolerans]